MNSGSSFRTLYQHQLLKVLSAMFSLQLRDITYDDLNDLFKKNLLSDGNMKGGGDFTSKKQFYLSQDMDVVYRRTVAR